MEDKTALVSVEINNSRKLKPERWTYTLVLSAFSCVIGASFQFGYHSGVLNTPEMVFKDFYNSSYYASQAGSESHYISESMLVSLWSVTVSIFCVGGMIGGFMGGFLSSILGRKKLMLINNVNMVTGCAMMFTCSVADSYALLIGGRFVVGFHAGISTVVSSLYLTEVAPLPLKGAAGTLNQLAIVVGVLTAQVLGLPFIFGNKDTFYCLLIVPLVPALLQVILLAYCPESPPWLFIYKKNASSAREGLVFLRRSNNVDDEMTALQQQLHDTEALEKVSFKDLLLVQHLRIPLIIAVCMQLSQQLSGINAVTYYSTSIFESADLSPTEAQYATLGIGGVIVAMTFVSVLLIDRLGRRFLHLTGLGGMFFSMAALTAALGLESQVSWIHYLGIAAIVLFVIFFSSGPGAIPWFITAELFEQNARAHAMGIANLVNWTANFAVGLLFPIMQKQMRFYAFVPFGVLLALFWIFTYKMVPETKNRPIEEIVSQFKVHENVKT